MDGLSLTPAALWLLPLVLAALIWIRFLRGRRQEVVAGSLLIWRRLAELQPVTPPRRVVLDRSLILQALALIALVAALARPEISADSSGRKIVVAVDNGPLARFRDTSGTPVWTAILSKSRQALETLAPTDRVLLVRSAPFPKLLTSKSVPPGEARTLLEGLTPALSGPDADTLFAFARNSARASNAQSVAIFSDSKPPSLAAQSNEWFCVGKKTRENVGIVAFGVTPFVSGEKETLQGLVRIHNAAKEPRSVSVRGTQDATHEWSAKLSIDSGADEVFTVDGLDASKELRVTLDSDDGLLEDNTLIAQPRKSERLRIRYHSPLPAMERLFSLALQAQTLPPDSKETADIEVFAGTPPQQLAANARALLLIEPNAGYRFFYDVGEAQLERPIVLRDESSALSANFKGGGEAGLFPVPHAVELLRTGSFVSLLKDARSQRSLAARFMDEQGRPGYVFAFTPGAGSAPAALLPGEVATLLIRIAREASGHMEPFVVEHAQDWETRTDSSAKKDLAVLDSAVTSLAAGDSTNGGSDKSLLVGSEPQKFSLRPWLVALGLLLLALDFLLARNTLRPARA